MGLIKKEINEPEFAGTMYVLTCEQTGLGLVQLLLTKDTDECNRIKAMSPFAPTGNSDWQEIYGKLSFGPVSKEDSMFPTTIDEIIVDDEETELSGKQSIIIKVGRYGNSQ